MGQRGNVTRVIPIDPVNPDIESLREAVEQILRGNVVAFPTETVYGLGADATNASAVGKIFEVKGRPADNPLIVHVASRDDVARIAGPIPAVAEKLMERFWPGPLTLVLGRLPIIPEVVSCGLPTVGVRMPSHPVAQALIREAGVPLAAPSANLSGRPSPTTAGHVLEDLQDRIDLVLDGGETGVGLESTVIDLTVDPPVLLRPGGVTVEDLIDVLGPISIDRSVDGTEFGERPRSPGMKYAHYAPKAKMIVVNGPLLSVQARLKDLIYEYMQEGKRVGVMCSAQSRGVYQAQITLEYGSREDLTSIASGLFGTIRAFDRHGADVVLAEGVPAHGLGLAIMNRLTRAAGGRVILV